MTITLAANVTGTMDAFDKRAALAVINTVNQNRVTPLPKSTNAEIKASLETILSEQLSAIHQQNIIAAAGDVGLRGAGFADADKDAIHAKMVDLVAAGQTPAQVLAKVAALA